MTIVVLRCLRYKREPRTGRVDALYEAAFRRPDELRWCEGRWSQMDESLASFPAAEECIRQAMTVPGAAATSQPWLRQEWFERVEAWMDAQLARLNLKRATPVIQLRCSTSAVLLRASAGRRAFYLKASHPDCPIETRLTPLLARSFPDRIPRVIGTDCSQNWMLLDGIPGTTLAYIGDLAIWQSALEAYGEMQASCTENQLSEWETVIPDHPLPAASAALDSWDALLDFVEAKGRVAREDIRMLREIGPPLFRKFARVSEFDIPSSLDHGDFHPFNVVASSRGCVFLDWSEASIAHPFLSAAGFLSYAERLRPDLPASNLISAYLRHWSKYASETQLAELWKLIQSIAPAYFAWSLWRVISTSRPVPEWERDEWCSGMRACLELMLSAHLACPHFSET